MPDGHRDPRIDLHLHTVASDGTLTAEELVLRAKSLGVAAIAITDHDSVGAVPDGLRAGRRHGVEVVPGVEIGIAHDPDRGLVEVDILGYFIDPDSCEIRDTMHWLQEAKNAKLVGQIDVLAANGYEIEVGEVLKEAAGDTVRRPHIWKVLSRHHPDLPAEEFFDRTSYGGDWHITKTFSVSLEECVKLIRRAGGVPVLAHPGAYNTTFAKGGVLIDPAVDTTVEVCADAGVGGIEVYYTYNKNRPFHNGSSLITDAEFEQLIGHYLSLAHRHHLLPTGGTDFHGSSKPQIEIGEIEIPYRLLPQLRHAAVKQ